MGWPVQVVGTTGSTNADLVARARAGARGPEVLAARAQTTGRGRLGRPWSSPPGASLAVSLLWAPPVPQPSWTWLPMVVGLGVVDGLAVLGVRAGLKWPNDVVVPVADGAHGSCAAPDGAAAPTPAGGHAGLAKLAGILVEVATGPSGPVVVAGVGVNLRPPEGLARVATSLPATSLQQLAPGREDVVSFARVLEVVAAALEQRLLAWARPAAPVRAEYLAVCASTGRRVRVSTPRAVHEGLAVDVDDDGALVVDTDQGLVRVSAGDVEHVR